MSLGEYDMKQPSEYSRMLKCIEKSLDEVYVVIYRNVSTDQLPGYPYHDKAWGIQAMQVTCTVSEQPQ